MRKKHELDESYKRALELSRKLEQGQRAKYLRYAAPRVKVYVPEDLPENLEKGEQEQEREWRQAPPSRIARREHKPYRPGAIGSVRYRGLNLSYKVAIFCKGVDARVHPNEFILDMYGLNPLLPEAALREAAYVTLVRRGFRPADYKLSTILQGVLKRLT